MHKWALSAINLLVLVFYSIFGGFWILISSKDFFGNPTPRRTFVMLILGGIGILFMSIYPMQLAFQGEEWLDCITERYPLQRTGFAGYVYVPTTWVLAIIFFGITLEARKILTNKQVRFAANNDHNGILLVVKFIRSEQCSGDTHTDGYDARVSYSLRLDTEAFYPVRSSRRKQLGIMGKWCTRLFSRRAEVLEPDTWKEWLLFYWI